MDALKAAAMRMGALREGRKSVIFVSEGFTGILRAQMSDPVASMPGYNNPYRGSSNTPQPTTREQQLNDSDMLYDMQQVFAAMTRENTSIYPVDPRGLAVFEYGVEQAVTITQDATSLRQTQDTLHVLASNTDGRAIINRNDLAAGMKQIIRDASGYYLLGYTSSQAPTDGKFHNIKVNVKRKGVEIRARKGYWAYTVDDVARANAASSKNEAPSAVASALNDLRRPPATGPRTSGSAQRAATRVSRTSLFHGSLPRSVPGQRPEDPPWRVALTAIAPDGRPVFRGKVPEDVGAPPPPGGGKGGAVSFDVPPGQLELKMVVEGTRGQVIDTVGRQVTVPDFTNVTMSLGTPRLFRVRTIPELQAIKNNRDAVPTTEREFSRTDRLYLRVDAYAPGGVTPPVDRATPQSDRTVDVRSHRAAGPGASGGNRAALVPTGRRRLPDRTERSQRRGEHGTGACRLQGRTLTLTDCGLRIDDCGFSDCRLEIEIVDCGLRFAIETADLVTNHQSSISISNPQSKSAIRNLNRQSAIRKSAIINPQSAVDCYAYMPLIFVTVATRLMATM